MPLDPFLREQSAGCKRVVNLFSYLCFWYFPQHRSAGHGSVVIWDGSLERSSWINLVFPLVIHSSTCAPCRHLFISSASLLWMKANFLNQNPCNPSWPGVFQFDIFSVVLSKSMCISAFGSSSSPSNSFVILLIHSAFLLCSLGCYILFQNCSVSLASGCWYVFMLSPPFVGRISFHCFWISCFVCIVDISLIFLLTPILSGLFPQVVWLIYFKIYVIRFLRVQKLHSELKHLSKQNLRTGGQKDKTTLLWTIGEHSTHLANNVMQFSILIIRTCSISMIDMVR